jgi:hypothetical protein
MVVVVTKGYSIDPCDTICASRTVFGIGASKTKGKRHDKVRHVNRALKERAIKFGIELGL